MKNHNIFLMGARLGEQTQNGTSIDNTMKSRLEFHGGSQQQDRMIKDKLRSLLKSLKYSYQGAWVNKIGDEKKHRALINPNKLKMDYDDKIISVPFEAGFSTGDVFCWNNTNSNWIIYSQELTELAYFRGDIRRCRFTITLDDGEKVPVAVRGPVETKINYLQKHQISVDTPNHSLNILLPNTEKTVEYFKRYSKFYLRDNTGMDNICWRVEAIDPISTPGILEVTAVEYYSNKELDDVENGIVNGLIEEVIPEPSEIKGDGFIKPKVSETFTCDSPGEWFFDTQLPIDIISLSDNSITLKWTSNYSGSFELKHGDLSRLIVVESLF